MEFTFGIITNGSNDNFINIIIDSIEQNNIPNYEIIIVGNSNVNRENTTILFFDESIKKAWITRKKNIIVENAKYENLVLLHDYVRFNSDWYDGFLKYGNDFDWCITRILTVDGSRFRDYTLFPYKVDYLNIDYSCADINSYFYNNCLLPYDFINNAKVNKYMYISGTYFVIKRNIALKHKLDENLLHDRGEDVEYSKRLNDNNIIIKCNQYSSVSFLKEKVKQFWENQISDEAVSFLNNWCDSNE